MIDWTQFFNSAPWGSWAPNAAKPPALPGAPAGYTGPTGNIGYGLGVGAYGPIPAAPAAPQDNGQGWANMERAAASLVAPANLPPPNLAMARPVGPGPLAPPRPGGAGAPFDFSGNAFQRMFQSSLT